MNMKQTQNFQNEILQGIPEDLPQYPIFEKNINRAPKKRQILNKNEKDLAIKNALRYIPTQHHKVMAKELREELEVFGQIYIYRYHPNYKISSRSWDEFPHKSVQAAGVMLMLSNNLDHAIAQHPYELVTYGGNGSVFQNWAQYRLCMKFLATMTDEQTLVLYSGHPLGLFPSHKEAPRVVVTNGLMIPNYSKPEIWEKYNALGVTQYGQMTAGSFMYIGPQGIVHGTTITILNAGRKIDPGSKNLAGKIFISCGLGGMSGAQGKAATIAGAVGVIAEINPLAARKRHEQGWIDEIFTDLGKLCSRMLEAKEKGEAVSLCYEGNVVDLWEYLAKKNIKIDIGSDQTSLHNPYGGGYYPVGISFDQAQEMLRKNPEKFKKCVQETLCKHVDAINKMCDQGMIFFDYGNAFLLESKRAGAKILNSDGEFRYPSYVQDIMGPMCFDYGFGPFRWVCGSSSELDLEKTDQLAIEVLENMIEDSPPEISLQMKDNLIWIKEASKNKLVVGSKARILYSNCEGRIALALRFNKAIRDKEVDGLIILGRDHHDVSGTDSPFRETSHIYDGSSFTADMSVQNFVGDSFRGATWVSLHNGGGVGIGEVMNGGFGMVLDGSNECDERIKSMMNWDVLNGVVRRSWARNKGAIWTTKQAMEKYPGLEVTIPWPISDDL